MGLIHQGYFKGQWDLFCSYSRWASSSIPLYLLCRGTKHWWPHLQLVDFQWWPNAACGVLLLSCACVHMRTHTAPSPRCISCKSYLLFCGLLIQLTISFDEQERHLYGYWFNIKGRRTINISSLNYLLLEANCIILMNAEPSKSLYCLRAS